MESYYRYWNEKIKDWYVSPTTTFENDIYSNIYRTKAQNYKLKPEFLPEPYLGSIENNCAVIINKNPGKEITELQVHNNGKFLVNDEAHLNYQSFAKTFPYLSKYNTDSKNNWWRKRLNWIERLSGSNTEKMPFAIEICPWHSNLFGRHALKIKDKDTYLNYLTEKIILPAEMANSNSDLKIILSVGGIFNYFYDELGFTKQFSLNNENFSDHPIKWHRNKNNNPVQNDFSVWESQRKHLYLNFTCGSNFNQVPSKKWSETEKYLLSLLRGL